MLPFRGRPLLTGPWLLNSIPHWRHSLQGTRQNWTDLSHHAQLSMCTSRDKMAASGMEFSVLIECEFVAVVSWKVGWWWFFHTKFALVRSDDWWVSFTRPWAVFTRLGRPDEWLVRALYGAAYIRGFTVVYLLLFGRCHGSMVIKHECNLTDTSPHTLNSRLPMLYLFQHCPLLHIDGLVQDCGNSSALAMELLQPCTKPWYILCGNTLPN